MPNGRCPPGHARGQAQHGGRSTGPRTEAGRAVLAAARTKHGHYGAEARTFVAAIDALLRGVPKQPARGRGTP